MRRPWPDDPRYVEAQLALLEALARSQSAVARMLEAAADAAASARLPAASIRKQLNALARVQGAMISAVAGVAPPRVKRGGPPPAPWLRPEAAGGRRGSGWPDGKADHRHEN